MANFGRGFAKGFSESYDQSSISKGMLEGYKKKEARDEFERWASVSSNQDMMERVGYTPHKDSTLDEFKGWADISSKMFTMGEKETKAERAGSFDSIMGSIMGEGFKTAGIVPPEEAMRRQDPSQLIGPMGQPRGVQPPQGMPQGMGVTGATLSPTGGSIDIDFTPEYLAEIKGKAKSLEAVKKATGNFGRVASSMKQYAKYYAGALKEGGVGNIGKKLKGQAVTQWIGGQAGEKMVDTGKLFGQRAELSLSMVPILTNQNRFMTSIMDYINKSLPQGHESKDLARGKFEQTLLNQFATTKVLSRLGYDPEIKEDVDKINQMDDEEAGALAQQIISLSQIYELSPEEQKEFDGIRDDVLGDLMGKKSKSKSFSGLWE